MNYLKNATSYSYCTCNEDGMQEVTVEYENGLIRSLFKKPRKVLTLVAEKGSATFWYKKETMEYATQYVSIALQVKRICQRQSMMMGV